MAKKQSGYVILDETIDKMRFMKNALATMKEYSEYDTEEDKAFFEEQKAEYMERLKARKEAGLDNRGLELDF